MCLKETTTLLIKRNKKLLNKLCENCTFLTDGRLIKQVDGCPLGGPVSAVFPNIFFVKMELDVFKPLNNLQAFCQWEYMVTDKNILEKFQIN